MDRAHGGAVARSAERVRRLEHRLQALFALGEARRVPPHLRGVAGRSGHGIRHGRRHHCQASPARPRRQRGTQSQAIGASRGGWTTKILALTDALGNLVRFKLLPGQRHDSVGVDDLIEGLTFGGLIGDKAFDNDRIRDELIARAAENVISQHPNRVSPLEIDPEIYKWRHLIENFFCKLKDFKRVALRAEKTDRCYEAVIYLAATVIETR